MNDDLVRAEAAGRREAAIARQRALDLARTEHDDQPRPEVPVDRPLQSAGGGARLEKSPAGYLLDGHLLACGDVIEVYTNRANGWIRGRFEWDGQGAPRVAINLWDPSGPLDEDALPPWVGDLDASLAPGAICRRKT